MAIAKKEGEEKSFVVDQTQVLGIQVIAHPVEQRAVIVTYAEGYNDENGKFIQVGRAKEPKAAHGEELQKILEDNPSLYPLIKTLAYEIANK